MAQSRQDTNGTGRGGQLVRLRRTAGHLATAARIGVRGLLDPHRPVLAQVVVMRRCNLACTYCNEYDRTSKPVPLTDCLRWMDRLAALGTEITTFSGGEPTLHPDLDIIIRRVEAIPGPGGLRSALGARPPTPARTPRPRRHRARTATPHHRTNHFVNAMRCAPRAARIGRGDSNRDDHGGTTWNWA